MAIQHIKTSTGFECDIDDSCIDDMELFEAVADLQAGNSLAIPTVIRKICGDNKAALYDHVRLENGRVPVQAVSEEISEIFEGLKAKNS